MERAANQPYGKLSKTTSAKRPATSDMNMKLPPHPTNTNTNVNNTTTNSIGTNGDNSECTVREQDRFMPIANVIRIMRKTLPAHAKISDDAKETIQECVSEFISFITGEANERCQREQRKTITAEDILWAMSKLGFDDYMEPLSIYLHKYREVEGDRAASTGSMSVRGVGDHGNSGIKRSSSNVEYGGGFGSNGFHYHNRQNPNGFLFGGLGLGLGPGGGSFRMKDGKLNKSMGTSSSRPPPTPTGKEAAAANGGRGGQQQK